MRKSKQPKPNLQPQFDDALPERLLDVRPQAEAGTPVRLRTGDAELSPFIVKLSREGAPALAEQTSSRALALDTLQEDPIAALARSLVIEHDDESDEAPLTVAHVNEHGLHLSIDDLKEQLREHEKTLDPVQVAPVTQSAANAQFDAAVPVDIWEHVQPVNMLEELGDIGALAPAPELELAVPETANVEVTTPAPVAVAIELVEQSESAIALANPPSYALRPTASVPRRHSWQRALVSFMSLALAAVLPLHALQVMADVQADGGTVEAESKAALDTFLRGATSLSSEEFSTAGEDFAHAAKTFADAEASLNDLHAGVTALTSVIPQTDRTVDSVRSLVTAGRELSETAAVMSTAADDLSGQSSLELTTKLDLLGAYMENALPHAQAARDALRQVDPTVVPESYVDSVYELQTRTPQLVASMEEYVRLVDTLSQILGGEEKMRYLAAFQNNTELRATGGFVGSFAEMDVQRGEVVRMFVPGGGAYDVQGQLQAYVAAPGPLQLLKARWEFQDANWFPDFPTSAKKLRWFYSEAGGPTTDGVVAVNATFVAELLRVLGPVEMPEYGRTFDAENFIFETQKIVELEYDKTENTPKAIIGDLAPILLERVKNADVPTLLAVVDLVAKGLEEKDILLNFRDNELQATVEDLGWSGSIKQTSGDYLMVVNTNLGGGKTDGVIDQDVDVRVRINDDGSIENTVTITKTHRGMKNALFTGSNNVDYLRLYVPKGSELISASGFEVPADELFETTDIPLAVDTDLALHMKDLSKDEKTGTDIWVEDGKTVFGNWMQTASGETEVVTFTYRLPVTVFAETEAESVWSMLKERLGVPTLGHYSMLVQKQPGVQHRSTTVEVQVPNGIVPIWSTQGDTAVTAATTTNATDAFIGWLFERE